MEQGVEGCRYIYRPRLVNWQMSSDADEEAA